MDNRYVILLEIIEVNQHKKIRPILQNEYFFVSF